MAAGRRPGAEVEEVTSPFDGAVVGTVPVATVEDVDAALTAAQAGAGRWRRTPAHERMRVLLRAAELADDRAEETARLISGECGSKHVGVVGAFAGRRKPHARRPKLCAPR